jgi:hypothetical protein
MRFLRFILLTVLILKSSLFSDLSYSITPSFRIFPSSSIRQYEPLIVISPLNPMVMFCSANTFNPANPLFPGEGVYATTNGGLNWFGADFCQGQPTNNHGGDPGIVIDKNGVFILKHVGNQNFTSNFGVYSHYSTDMGTTWSNAYTLSSQIPPEDKGSMTTDNNPSSPFYGRTYITGVNFQPPYPVLTAYTTNSGLSWSAYTAINGSAIPPNRCSGGELEKGPNGQVYDAWAAVVSNPPSTELFAGFATSSDGGVNWNVISNIFNMHGISGILTQKGNILANGIPRIAVDHSSGPRRGWIYVVTNETNNAPAGADPDIIFHRSTNGGLTWSQGIRVNQDPVNNGKIQFFPAICVDSTGAIDILYYDDRNTTSDSSDVFMSRSTNGGSNWYDFEVSDKTFKPKPIVTSKLGDFIGIASARNKLFPVWMANYTGTDDFQIWMTILDLDAIGVQKISSEVPNDFVLEQNYPNPFNPVTKIKFSLPAAVQRHAFDLQLIVYDVLGKEVASLIPPLWGGQQGLKPGTYEVEWDGTNYPSGVYYYRLIAYDPSTSSGQSFSVSKKMILLK